MAPARRRILSPLRVPACRSLFAAQAVSGVGDWAGRLALAALVFDRSDSAWWTAAVTIVSLVPWLGPGQLLATLADRAGRITVMITADLVRAAAFAFMIVPQPTWMLLVLAFVAGLCAPPFAGARSSALVELTPPGRYADALALYGALTQAEVMIGYAVGGLVIAVSGADVALAANAASFAISAAFLVPLRRSPAGAPVPAPELGIAGVRAGLRVWRTDRVSGRALALFAGVSMFMVLPEALVVPFADQVDVPSRTVGVLAALIALGSLTAVLLAPRATDHQRLLRIAAARAGALSAGALVLFALGARPVTAALAYAVTGAVDAVAVPTNQVVGERLPSTGRAAAMAVAGGVQYASQALSVTVFGAVAALWSPHVALMVGMALAAGVSLWAVVAPIRESAPLAVATLTTPWRPPLPPPAREVVDGHGRAGGHALANVHRHRAGSTHHTFPPPAAFTPPLTSAAPQPFEPPIAAEHR
jgi:predicted MFS family arabinose efflux permease